MRVETPAAKGFAASLDGAWAVGLCLVPVALAWVARLTGWADLASVRNWLTVFVAVTLQAFPFLVLGVAISATIAVFVPPGVIQRVLPKRSLFAVPVACAAGAALPGCECGSVPIAGRLVSGGAPGPAALAFMLAAPAVNPVVLVATSIAFPNRPAVVAARFFASFLTAAIMGWIWIRREPVHVVGRPTHDHEHGGSVVGWMNVVLDDFLHTAGFLVIGAAGAATLQTVVPRSVLDGLAGNGVAAVLVMAALAVLLAVCSEADAFVASGLTQFSLTARLVFMVVGPVVDVKLIAMQVATFGRRFAVRFSSVTLVVAIAVAAVVGAVLL